MHDRLSIGLSAKLVPGLTKFLTELLEVFDDTVMNQYSAPIRVRMSISLCRQSMGRPTVCPIPILPRNGFLSMSASRLAIFPSARRRLIFPSTNVATPAES